MGALEQGLGTALGTAVGGPVGGAVGGAVGGSMGGSSSSGTDSGQKNGMLKDLMGKAKGQGMKPLGIAIGAGQTLMGMLQRKKANAMTPAPYTPEEAANYRLTKRMQQRAGATGGFNQMNQLGQTAKNYTNTMFKYGGRNINALSNLLSQNMNTIAEQQAGQQLGLLNSQIGQAQAFGETSRDLALLRRNEMMARAEQNVMGGNRNLFASLNMGAKNANNSTGTGTNQTVG